MTQGTHRAEEQQYIPLLLHVSATTLWSSIRGCDIGERECCSLRVVARVHGRDRFPHYTRASLIRVRMPDLEYSPRIAISGVGV